MPKKKPTYKKPERPKPVWPWRKAGGPAWLLSEPARLAPLGGAVFALVALTFYFVRQSMGAAMPPMQVFTGVAVTFVVGYAATGCFVWYVLRVSWREFPPVEKEVRRRRRFAEDEVPGEGSVDLGEEPLVEVPEEVPAAVPEEVPAEAPQDETEGPYVIEETEVE